MQSGGGKNPPWARSNVNTNMTGMNSQMVDANSMMSQQNIMPFQQTQAVFNKNFMQTQGAMGMAMGGQMPMNQMAQGQMYPGNVVAYPTPRAMNPGMYQNAQANASQSSTEQRVFTGTVTQAHNEIGFVDNDVFYQTSVCAKGIIPKVNDRVLVEAIYNPNMPFKWNAARVQVLPKSGSVSNNKSNAKSNSYNAAPPPVSSNKKSQPSRRDDRPIRRDERKRSRTRSRSRSRDRRDSRNRRDSPPRKRPVVHQPSPPKYVVRVPRIPLDIQTLDVPTLSQRYTNLYVPSDFFSAHVKWGETFPPQAPFSLNNPCAYHVMNKDIPNPAENDAVLEPPDADYRFSAKVMLISMPTLETLYQKCGLTKDEKEKRSSSKSPQHPTRLIKFLVGQKGKGGENFAIGGPWSPSLDGENPDTDPGVLVKTAIRTCKALTGVDLSSCAQWYRMVEFYYWREGSGGKSRLETVVLFLPDVWSAQLSRVDWTSVQEQYKAAYEAAVKKLDGQSEPPPADAAEKSQIDNIKENDANETLNTTANETITIDENDDEEDKPEPTHHSKIDIKTIKVDQLRQELRARNVSCKGNRSQLVSRLSKILKTEASENKEEVMEVEAEGDKEQEAADQTITETVEIKDDKEDKSEVVEVKPVEEKKVKTEKEIEEEKKKLEKEKQFLKIHYELPGSPHIIVHPSTSAKGGKFNCTAATLSLLLDYRISDNKEHSFELFVFAELFNEMLMRDFGFYIYKTLYTLPEKVDEVKESKDKHEKDGDKKDDKDEHEKVEKEEKKDEKKNDKRESRKRKDSHSDDDRSNSPRRKGRGVELPPDPYLLLSLVYFDTSRGGTISKKDLQNLFMSLGLQLSRSQIKSIMEKVCVRDSFSYKALVQAIKDLASGTVEAIQDLPLDTAMVSEVPSHITDLETTIATGNRNLLPVFNKPGDEEAASRVETKDISDTGMVMYKSRVIDVAALVSAEARNAAHRQRVEASLETLRKQLQAAKAAAASTQQAERGAQSQLSDVSNSLQTAKARITSLTASSKIFHAALKNIQAKVEAVINIKYEDDDVVEVVNGPSKVEKKDLKKEDIKKEEVKKEEAKKDEPQTEQNEYNKTSKDDVPDSNKESATPLEHDKVDDIATENMELSDKE